jgi:hypothetical protein
MIFDCSPTINPGTSAGKNRVPVLLYGISHDPGWACAGKSLADRVRRSGIEADSRAWDLLSVALSVVVADLCGRRSTSPDGWTRMLELRIGVNDPAFWSGQKVGIERMLSFLTTDIWSVSFRQGRFVPSAPRAQRTSSEDSVLLLSGGLDSLVGLIDAVGQGKSPLVVSHLSRGDAQNQRDFAASLGRSDSHLQVSHSASVPGLGERSQRARSLAFLSYAVLAATSLKRYVDGQIVPVYVCENGFISINPPLTTGRIGSLTTRTTNYRFLQMFGALMDAAGLRVAVENPYMFATKGEMLSQCRDQERIRSLAHKSTSCSRFAHYSYRQCGRCFPCLVRRAAFVRWGVPDRTRYRYRDLSADDATRARSDDVRSVAMAVSDASVQGIDAWAAGALSGIPEAESAHYRSVVERGLAELRAFLSSQRVR